MKPIQEILGDIVATAPEAEPPAELRERVETAAASTAEEIKNFRLKLLFEIGLYVEDAMRDHPELGKDALLRIAANEAILVHCMIVRGLKRRLGEEIVPARMALIAYSIADMVLGMEWEDQNSVETAIGDKGSLRDLLEECMNEETTR